MNQSKTEETYNEIMQEYSKLNDRQARSILPYLIGWIQSYDKISAEHIQKGIMSAIEYEKQFNQNYR